MNEWLNLLGLANRAGKIITGEESIIKNIRNKKVLLVIVAEDASSNTKKKLKDKCTFYQIEYIESGMISDISRAIGKQNRVAVGIIDEGFMKGLLAKLTKKR